MGNDKKLFIETLAVVAVTIILFIAFNSLRSIIAALPALYLIVERRLKHKSWSDVGFKFKNTLPDVKKNWHWILLVGAASPLLTFFSAKFFMPGYIEHVILRLPMNVNVIVQALITAAIGTFLEEIIFRGFIQDRLSKFAGVPGAIIAASILFSLMHFSQGSASIVIFDLVGIFIDSILFGVIYAKTRNIFASWSGHFLSDLVGIVCLLFFI